MNLRSRSKTQSTFKFSASEIKFDGAEYKDYQAIEENIVENLNVFLKKDIFSIATGIFKNEEKSRHFRPDREIGTRVVQFSHAPTEFNKNLRPLTLLETSFFEVIQKAILDKLELIRAEIVAPIITVQAGFVKLEEVLTQAKEEIATKLEELLIQAKKQAATELKAFSTQPKEIKATTEKAKKAATGKKTGVAAKKEKEVTATDLKEWFTLAEQAVTELENKTKYGAITEILDTGIAEIQAAMKKPEVTAGIKNS